MIEFNKLVYFDSKELIEYFKGFTKEINEKEKLSRDDIAGFICLKDMVERRLENEIGSIISEEEIDFDQISQLNDNLNNIKNTKANFNYIKEALSFYEDLSDDFIYNRKDDTTLSLYMKAAELMENSMTNGRAHVNSYYPAKQNFWNQMLLKNCAEKKTSIEKLLVDNDLGNVEVSFGYGLKIHLNYQGLNEVTKEFFNKVANRLMNHGNLYIRMPDNQEQFLSFKNEEEQKSYPAFKILKDGPEKNFSEIKYEENKDGKDISEITKISDFMDIKITVSQSHDDPNKDQSLLIEVSKDENSYWKYLIQDKDFDFSNRNTNLISYVEGHIGEIGKLFTEEFIQTKYNEDGEFRGRNKKRAEPFGIEYLVNRIDEQREQFIDRFEKKDRDIFRKMEKMGLFVEDLSNQYRAYESIERQITTVVRNSDKIGLKFDEVAETIDPNLSKRMDSILNNDKAVTYEY